MPIDVSCKGCQARYRVNDTLAGRLAECRHCGQKFQIPYRSPIVRLDDEMLVEAPPAGTGEAAARPAARARRSFEEYEPLTRAGQLKKKREQPPPDPPLIPLPPILSEIWLPIIIATVCYGLTIYLGLSYALRSHGAAAGVIMLAVLALLIWAGVVPLTVRAIEGASLSFDFRLPNSLYLQTAAWCSLPIFTAALGLYVAGFHAMVAGALIGLAVATLLLLVMFQLPAAKGVQAELIAALCFVISSAASVAFVWMLSIVFIPRWGLNLPWQEPDEGVLVALAAPAEASTNESTAAPPSAAPALTSGPPAPPPPPAAQAQPTAADPVEAADALAAAPSSIFDFGADEIDDPPAADAAAAPVELDADLEPLAEAHDDFSSPPEATAAPPAAPVVAVAPAELLKIAAQGEWTISVVAVTRPDVNAIDAELRALRTELSNARRHASEQRAAAARIESETVSESVRGTDGIYRTVKKKKHSSRVIGEARVNAQRAERAVQRINESIARLQRQREEADSTRTVSGVLGGGVPTQIDVTTVPHAALADTMTPGEPWVVSGAGRITEGLVTVKPRTLKRAGEE